MKYLILLVFLLQTCALAAQSSRPAYLRFPTVPPFSLTMVDSAQLTRDDLPANKRLMLIFFSPSCHHCRDAFDDLLRHLTDFAETEIVMATYQPFEEMQAFYAEKEISKYPNIKMGRDGKYFLPPFFKMTGLPFFALYNRKGKLVAIFDGPTSMEKIAEAFEKNQEIKSEKR